MAGADDTNDIIMQLVQKVSRVEALLEGLIDHEFHAKERNDIRRETHHIVDEAAERIQEIANAQLAAKSLEASKEAKKYTDDRVRDLEKQIEARQARDESIASSVRRQFAMTVGVALVGIAYALYRLVTTGGL